MRRGRRRSRLWVVHEEWERAKACSETSARREVLGEREIDVPSQRVMNLISCEDEAAGFRSLRAMGRIIYDRSRGRQEGPSRSQLSDHARSRFDPSEGGDKTEREGRKRKHGPRCCIRCSLG